LPQIHFDVARPCYIRLRSTSQRRKSHFRVPILRVAIAFNLYVTAFWNFRAGVNATVLGFNVLAIVMLILFLWSRTALTERSDESDRESV